MGSSAKDAVAPGPPTVMRSWILHPSFAPKLLLLVSIGSVSVLPAAEPAVPRIDPEARARIRAKVEKLDRPHDDPDRAREWSEARRTIVDPALGRDRAALLESALRRTREMGTHSTVSGRIVESGSPEERAALATWTTLGPGNIGGRIRALSIHPTRPNTMVAGGVSGGIWTTTNGGASWTPRGDFLVNLAIGSLVRSPADPEVLYAGTGEGYFREEVRGTALPLRGAGIYRSTDGGTSWARLPSTNNGNFHWVNDLAVSTADPSRIYAATRTGVWRSTNGGGAWSSILAPGVKGGCLDLALRTDRETDVLFASCGTFARATVWRTERAEQSTPQWESVLSESGMGRTSLALAPSDQDVVLALAASIAPGAFDGGLHAFFRSDTGGAPGTWTALVRNGDSHRLSTLLLSNPVIATLDECGFEGSSRISSLGWYANVVAVDPTDPDVIWAGGVDLFRSDDGGRTWGPITYWWDSPPSAHADQHVIAFHPGWDGAGNRTMFLAGDGGVWRTPNARAGRSTDLSATCNPASTAVAWASLNHDLGVTQFYQGTPTPDGSRVLGGTQDNGTIRAAVGARNSWEKILGGDGGYVAVDPTNPSVLYAETQFLGLRKSIDGGSNWALAVQGIQEGQDDVLFIMPFVMDPSDPRRLWTGGRRLWRTSDGAGQWSQASPTLAGGGRVSALAVDPTDPQRVLAGLDTGHVHRQTGALGAGAGTPWPSVLPRPGYVSWLAVDPGNPAVAYATYAGFGGTHVWRSIDHGATWGPLDGSGSGRLPDIPVHSIAVDPADGRRLYLGTDLGVFVSVDGGERWLVENTGYAHAVTESLALLEVGADSWLYAFTHGRGAWRTSLVDVGPVEPGTLQIVDPAPVVAEGDGSVYLTVERTGGAGGAVEVGYQTVPGTALPSEDYRSAQGTLRWADGDGGPRPIRVTILDDVHPEGDESFRVVLGEPVGGADLTGPDTAEVTILDDEVEPGECVEGEATLCLNRGRFRVEVTFETAVESDGAASVAPPRTDDSGLFWFFGPDNWELLVKVLDGCAINGRYWVFSAATTDVAHTLTVTDTVAGVVRRWSNPAGTAADAITDTEAFPTCGIGADPGRHVDGTGAVASAAESPGSRSSGAESVASGRSIRGGAALPREGACVADETALCLGDGRFRVEVDWATADGGEGAARAVPVGGRDSGLFWFFGPDNWEMLVKVLDGCALNDRFWVFAAATTDLETTLRVTDEVTGEMRQYVHEAGSPSPAVTDTEAFASCSE